MRTIVLADRACPPRTIVSADPPMWTIVLAEPPPRGRSSSAAAPPRPARRRGVLFEVALDVALLFREELLDALEEREGLGLVRGLPGRRREARLDLRLGVRQEDVFVFDVGRLRLDLDGVEVLDGALRRDLGAVAAAARCLRFGSLVGAPAIRGRGRGVAPSGDYLGRGRGGAARTDYPCRGRGVAATPSSRPRVAAIQ